MLVVKTLSKRIPASFSSLPRRLVPKRKLHLQPTKPLPTLIKTRPLWVKVTPYWLATALGAAIGPKFGIDLTVDLSFLIGATFATTIEYLEQLRFEKLHEDYVEKNSTGPVSTQIKSSL